MGESAKVSALTTYKMLRKLRSHDLNNDEQMRILQNRGVRELMKYAYDIPFYRAKFEEAGVLPEDFNTAEDLKNFPTTGKEELRGWIETETAAHPDKYVGWITDSTTGSTGRPLTVYHTPHDAAMINANWARICFASGFGMRDKMLCLRYPKDDKPMVNKDGFAQKLGFARRFVLSSVAGGEEMLEALNSYRPEFFYAQRSKIEQLVNYADDNGLELFRPETVCVFGESVDEKTEAMLRGHFGRTYFTAYGSNETGACAFTKKGTLTDFIVTRDTHVINVYEDESGDPQSARAVITNLFLRGFPIINYELGDCVEVDKETGVIKRIIGRANDVLTFSDGSIINWPRLYGVMKSLSEVSQFRYIQEGADLVRIQLVESRKADVDRAAVEKKLSDNLSKYIKAPEVRYAFEWLDELPPDKSGKRRFIIRNV